MKKDKTGVYPVQVRLNEELYSKALKMAYERRVTVNTLLKHLLQEKK